MMWWILLWLGRSVAGGGPVTPTPVDLPFLRRNGADFGTPPTFIRRSS